MFWTCSAQHSTLAFSIMAILISLARIVIFYFQPIEFYFAIFCKFILFYFLSIMPAF